MPARKALSDLTNTPRPNQTTAFKQESKKPPNAHTKDPSIQKVKAIDSIRYYKSHYGKASITELKTIGDAPNESLSGAQEEVKACSSSMHAKEDSLCHSSLNRNRTIHSLSETSTSSHSSYKTNETVMPLSHPRLECSSHLVPRATVHNLDPTNLNVRLQQLIDRISMATRDIDMQRHGPRDMELEDYEDMKGIRIYDW